MYTVQCDICRRLVPDLPNILYNEDPNSRVDILIPYENWQKFETFGQANNLGLDEPLLFRFLIAPDNTVRKQSANRQCSSRGGDYQRDAGGPCSA